MNASRIEQPWWVGGLGLVRIADLLPHLGEPMFQHLAGIDDGDTDAHTVIAAVLGGPDAPDEAASGPSSAPPDQAPRWAVIVEPPSGAYPLVVAAIDDSVPAALAKPLIARFIESEFSSHDSEILDGQLLEPAIESIDRLCLGLLVADLAPTEPDLLSAIDHRQGDGLADWWKARPNAIRQIWNVLKGWQSCARFVAEALSDRPPWLVAEPIIQRSWDAGDVHRGGLPVVTVSGKGSSAALHPRSIDGLVILQRVVDLLASKTGTAGGVAVPRIWKGRSAGWVQWIEGYNLSEVGASEFGPAVSRSLGELLAIVYFLGGSGLETDHLFVVEDQIVVSQIDGLLTPVVGSASENQPSITDWLAVLVGDNQSVNQTEFELGFHQTADHLQPEVGPLAQEFDRAEVRLFARDTIIYAELLEQLDKPQVVIDASFQDALLSRLRMVPSNVPASASQHLAHEEVADLRKRDIPYLTTSPGSHQVEFSTGRVVEGLILTTGRQQAEARFGGQERLRVNEQIQAWFTRC